MCIDIRTSFVGPSRSGRFSERSTGEDDGDGEGEFGNAMLNDVLAVCIGIAVLVVIATMLGVVELLWKAVAAIVGR